MRPNSIAAAWDPNLEPLDEAVDHVRGPAGAPLIIEYGDYECPYSRLASSAGSGTGPRQA